MLPDSSTQKIISPLSLSLFNPASCSFSANKMLDKHTTKLSVASLLQEGRAKYTVGPQNLHV